MKLTRPTRAFQSQCMGLYILTTDCNHTEPTTALCVLFQPSPLFAKIDPALIAELKKRFAGDQASRNTPQKTGGAAAVVDEAAVAELTKQVQQQVCILTYHSETWPSYITDLLSLRLIGVVGARTNIRRL